MLVLKVWFSGTLSVGLLENVTHFLCLGKFEMEEFLLNFWEKVK